MLGFQRWHLILYTFACYQCLPWLHPYTAPKVASIELVDNLWVWLHAHVITMECDYWQREREITMLWPANNVRHARREEDWSQSGLAHGRQDLAHCYQAASGSCVLLQCRHGIRCDHCSMSCSCTVTVGMSHNCGISLQLHNQLLQLAAWWQCRLQHLMCQHFTINNRGYKQGLMHALHFLTSFW